MAGVQGCEACTPRMGSTAPYLLPVMHTEESVWQATTEALPQAPHTTSACHTMLHNATQCHTMPYATPCQIMSDYATPYLTMRHHATSCASCRPFSSFCYQYPWVTAASSLSRSLCSHQRYTHTCGFLNATLPNWCIGGLKRPVLWQGLPCCELGHRVHGSEGAVMAPLTCKDMPHASMLHMLHATAVCLQATPWCCIALPACPRPHGSMCTYLLELAQARMRSGMRIRDESQGVH